MNVKAAGVYGRAYIDTSVSSISRLYLTPLISPLFMEIYHLSYRQGGGGTEGWIWRRSEAANEK